MNDSKRYYRDSSGWNNENEICCLIIFKKLQLKSFPRGKQMEYCREMALSTSLSAENISAKVGNYKSVAGINNHSNASKNTKDLYKKYKDLSSNELENLLKKIKFKTKS